MNKIYILSLIVSSILFSANIKTDTSMNNIVKPKHTDFNVTNKHASNEAIIVLKDGSNKNIIDEFFKNSKGYKGKHLKTANAMNVKVPNKSFEEIKEMIEKNPLLSSSIKSVEPNYAHKIFEASDDLYYSDLWSIENTGQSINYTEGTNDADMDVKEAWSIEKGSSNAVVAVIDTGVDYTHSDLADNMWRGNINHGYDFAGDDDGNNDDNPMPDAPYDDNGHYHGTHVAGIIGAVGNNSVGVSGIAQNIQIMALKVFRPNGYAYTSDILEAIDYISEQKDNGVNIVVVNASFGGDGSPGDSMDIAIEELGKKGIVFCVAAGNDGKNIDNEPIYPASYTATNIITIAASDQNDMLASFSNYGEKSVDVSAPGTNILSTYPDNQYAYLQGTSMATPNVAGIVALISSANPSLSADNKVKAIVDNVDKTSNLINKVATSGRVNAYNSLKNIVDNSNINNEPKANDDSVTTDKDKKVLINVLLNDSDIDGDNLIIKSVTTPSHGVAYINDNSIDYIPNSGYVGDDNFSYTIDDGNGGTSSANVIVTINNTDDNSIVKDSGIIDKIIELSEKPNKSTIFQII